MEPQEKKSKQEMNEFRNEKKKKIRHDHDDDIDGLRHESCQQRKSRCNQRARPDDSDSEQEQTETRHDSE